VSKPGYEQIVFDAKVPMNDRSVELDIVGKRIIGYRFLGPSRVRVLLEDQYSFEGALTELLPKNVASLFAGQLNCTEVFFEAATGGYTISVQAGRLSLEIVSEAVDASFPAVRCIAAKRAYELAEHWEAKEITEALQGGIAQE